jgi:hypothetical protein
MEAVAEKWLMTGGMHGLLTLTQLRRSIDGRKSHITADDDMTNRTWRTFREPARMI